MQDNLIVLRNKSRKWKRISVNDELWKWLSLSIFLGFIQSNILSIFRAKYHIELFFLRSYRIKSFMESPVDGFQCSWQFVIIFRRAFDRKVEIKVFLLQLWDFLQRFTSSFSYDSDKTERRREERSFLQEVPHCSAIAIYCYSQPRFHDDLKYFFLCCWKFIFFKVLL